MLVPSLADIANNTCTIQMWEMESAVPEDIKYIVVKFWTGRITDEDVETYLTRFCQLLQPVQATRPVQHMVWRGKI